MEDHVGRRSRVASWARRGASRHAEAPPLREQLRDDVQRMMQHCRDRGISVPDEATAIVRRLEPALEQAGEPQASLKDLLDLQGALGALVKPATPRSLEGTEIKWNRKTRLTWLLLIALTLASI